MRLKPAVSIAAAVLLMGVASVADARSAASVTPSNRIVPYESIGPIKLGDSRATVRRILGAPDSVVNFTDGKIATFYYDHLALNVFFADTRPYTVDSIATRSRRFYGPHGLHVGSSFSAVKRVYPHLAYETRGTWHQYRGRFGHSRSIAFFVHHHRVQGIDIDTAP